MAGVLAGHGDWGNVATLVCDLDGVIYVDGAVIPGAATALEALQHQGRRLLFVTNNSTKTSRIVVDTIAQLTGFQAEERDVVTAGLVTAMTLEGLVDRVLVVGGPALVETFRSRGFTVVSNWRRAEAVACGLNFHLTYDDLAAATLAIRAGALFYATNTDATYPTAEGQKPGGGAIVAALETATGIKAVVCGKPHAPLGDAVRKIVGEEKVLVIGDRFETDVALGKAQGWFTALVLTGVTTAASEAPPGLNPDIVVDSLADLPAVLGAR